MSASESTLPVPLAVTPRRQDPTAARRQQRHRRRILRELFAGRVETCAGPLACTWTTPESPCDCEPSMPCRCERRYLKTIQDAAEEHIGSAVGPLLASAILDVARAVKRGDEDEIRATRIQLLNLLLRDQRTAQDLEQRERRLKIEEEARSRRKGPALGEYLEAKYGKGNANGAGRASCCTSSSPGRRAAQGSEHCHGEAIGADPSAAETSPGAALAGGPAGGLPVNAGAQGGSNGATA